MTTPANHTACPLCSKDVSWSCLDKHIFAKAHVQDYLKPKMLASSQYALGSWRKMTAARTVILDVKDGVFLYMCLGCKKAKRSPLDHDHFTKCGKGEEHLLMLRALVGEPTGEEVAAEPDEAVKLRKQIVILERKIKNMEEVNEEFADESIELTSLFKRVTGFKVNEFKDTFHDALNGHEPLQTYKELYAANNTIVTVPTPVPIAAPQPYMGMSTRELDELVNTDQLAVCKRGAEFSTAYDAATKREKS